MWCITAYMQWFRDEETEGVDVADTLGRSGFDTGVVLGGLDVIE